MTRTRAGGEGGSDISPLLEIEHLVAEFADRPGRRGIHLQFLRGPLEGQRVEVDASSQYPGASVMKVLVAIGVHHLAAQGGLSLDEAVRVGEVWWPHPEDGSVLAVLDPDHVFSIRELAGMMLVASDNRIGSYLVERVGPTVLARVARGLGCEATSFDHPFDPRDMAVLHITNQTTARDVAIWLRHIYRGTVPGADDIRLAMRHTPINNRLTARFDEFQAHKTGTLTGVANDAAIVGGVEHDVSLVVLSAHQPDNLVFGMECADLTAAIWAALGEATG